MSGLVISYSGVRGVVGRDLDPSVARRFGVAFRRMVTELHPGGPVTLVYERAGFRTIHVRPSYYQDNGEDALVMLSEWSP